MFRSGELRGSLHLAKNKLLVITYNPRPIELFGRKLTGATLLNTAARRAGVELVSEGSEAMGNRTTDYFYVDGNAAEAKVKLDRELYSIYGFDAEQFSSFLRQAAMLAPTQARAR